MEKESTGFNKKEHWKGVNAICKIAQNKSGDIIQILNPSNSRGLKIKQEPMHLQKGHDERRINSMEKDE